MTGWNDITKEADFQPMAIELSQNPCCFNSKSNNQLNLGICHTK
jgi:hypothetical protein